MIMTQIRDMSAVHHRVFPLWLAAKAAASRRGAGFNASRSRPGALLPDGRLAMLVRDQPGAAVLHPLWREPARGGACEAAAVLPPGAGPTEEETWLASSW